MKKNQNDNSPQQNEDQSKNRRHDDSIKQSPNKPGQHQNLRKGTEKDRQGKDQVMSKINGDSDDDRDQKQNRGN